MVTFTCTLANRQLCLDTRLRATVTCPVYSHGIKKELWPKTRDLRAPTLGPRGEHCHNWNGILIKGDCFRNLSFSTITFYQILRTLKKWQVIGLQESNFIPFGLHVIFLTNE